MGSRAKFTSILLMAIMVVAVCHAKCSDENSPVVSDTLAVDNAGDKVESSTESFTTKVAKVFEESEAPKTKKACECVADSEDSSVPKTEQVVIKKVGKNKVITITLPAEAQGVEYVFDATSASTTVPTPAESDSNEKVSNVEEESKEEDSQATPKASDVATPEESGGVEEVEAEKPAPEEVKKQKTKADKTKKKFKRDVGKKSSQKKSPKRKNKEQKRKSKK